MRNFKFPLIFFLLISTFSCASYRKISSNQYDCSKTNGFYLDCSYAMWDKSFRIEEAKKNSSTFEILSCMYYPEQKIVSLTINVRNYSKWGDKIDSLGIRDPFIRAVDVKIFEVKKERFNKKHKYVIVDTIGISDSIGNASIHLNYDNYIVIWPDSLTPVIFLPLNIKDYYKEKMPRVIKSKVEHWRLEDIDGNYVKKRRL
ncbi:MAG: hypothetical protein ACT6QS_07710 [Flavobacteriales bacterium]